MRRLGSREVVFWVGDDGALRVETIPHPFVSRWLSGLAGEMVGRRDAYRELVVQVAFPGSEVDQQFSYGIGEIAYELGTVMPREQARESGVSYRERAAKITATRTRLARHQQALLSLAAAQLGIERNPNGRLPAGTKDVVRAHARTIRHPENDPRWMALWPEHRVEKEKTRDGRGGDEC